MSLKVYHTIHLCAAMLIVEIATIIFYNQDTPKYGIATIDVTYTDSYLGMA